MCTENQIAHNGKKKLAAKSSNNSDWETREKALIRDPIVVNNRPSKKKLNKERTKEKNRRGKNDYFVLVLNGHVNANRQLGSIWKNVLHSIGDMNSSYVPVCIFSVNSPNGLMQAIRLSIKWQQHNPHYSTLSTCVSVYVVHSLQCWMHPSMPDAYS